MEDLGKKTLKQMIRRDHRRLYTLHNMSVYRNSFNGYDVMLREISDRPAISILRTIIANTTVSVSTIDRLAEIRDKSMTILEFMSTHMWICIGYQNLIGNKPLTLVRKVGWENSLYTYSQNQHLEYNLYGLASITNPTKHNLKGYVNEKKCKS